MSYCLTVTFFFIYLIFNYFSLSYNFIFFIFFILTFIFKAPLFPFVNWLIFLHVYSPTFVSVFLASFYLKLSALFF